MEKMRTTKKSISKLTIARRLKKELEKKIEYLTKTYSVSVTKYDSESIYIDIKANDNTFTMTMIEEVFLFCKYHSISMSIKDNNITLFI